MRHRIAGSKTVVARGLNETSLLVQRRMGLNEILKQLMNYDFCVLEGFNNAHLPKIITARTWEEVDSFLDSDTIAISGVAAVFFHNDRFCGLRGSARDHHLYEERAVPV